MKLLKSELDYIVKTNDVVYDFIQESTLEGFWYLNLEDTLIVYPNIRFLKSIGYNAEESDWVVSNWKNILSADELKKLALVFIPGHGKFQLLQDQPICYQHKNGFTSFTINDILVFFNALGDPVRLLVGVKVLADDAALKIDDFNKIFINQAPNAIAMFDTDMKYLAASEKWIRDYKLEGQNIIGLSHYTVFPEVGADWKQIHSDALKGVVNSCDEALFEREDGSRQWISWDIRPWYLLNNEIGGIIMYTADIAARKRFEDDLRISEESFRGTFEHAAIGMALVDPDGKWLRVNKSLSAMLGYSDEELLKLNFQDITHPEDLETDLNFLNELITGKRISCEMEKRYIDKQGVVVWAILSVSLVRDQEGNPLHFISQITNNTERKIAEQRLEHSLNKLEEILEASTQVSIISTDSKGVITSFNKGAENLLGYEAEELIMKCSLSVLHIGGEMDQRARELSEILGKDIAGFNVFVAYPSLGQPETREWTYLRKDGSAFPVQLVVTAMKNGKGEVEGFLGIGTDISKIKKVENEIKALLNVTKDQNHRLLNFAHIVSHNLRSHTSNIDKLLDFIEEDDDVVSRNELLGMLRRAADSLSETINHLNDVVIMNNVTQENLVPGNLKHVIVRAAENIQALLRSTGGKFECHVTDDLMVAVVPAYLDSILINLLSNAIKYRSERRALQVIIRAVQEGEFVKISIQDNGLGIDMESKGNRVFGMYETFHEGKDSRGIGLFITRNQVEAMGGSIDVVSRVEVGTTFNVYLKRYVE